MNTACRNDNNSCCCCAGNGSGFGSAIEGLLFGLLLYIGIQQLMMGMGRRKRRSAGTAGGGRALRLSGHFADHDQEDSLENLEER